MAFWNEYPFTAYLPGNEENGHDVASQPSVQDQVLATIEDPYLQGNMASLFDALSSEGGDRVVDLLNRYYRQQTDVPIRHASREAEIKQEVNFYIKGLRQAGFVPTEPQARGLFRFTGPIEW